MSPSATESRYYIVAQAEQADDRTRVLKHGETFAVFDRHGDAQPVGLREQGLYHQGTRFLSTMVLSLDGHRPLLLGSTVKQDDLRLVVDMMNPDVCVDGRVLVPRGALHLYRTKFLHDGVCHERLRITNYSFEQVAVPLVLELAADYADVFEVRGMRRERRGSELEPELGADGIVLGYTGLDGVTRRTRIQLDRQPEVIAPNALRLQLELPPHGQETIELAVACELEGARRRALSFASAQERAAAELADVRRLDGELRTSNEQVDRWLSRSLADVHMMVTLTEHGPYPFAGVPWFSAPFGRDGIITALEMLWLDPSIARGVLRYLAATQATREDEAQDAQPGKIVHEVRGGEMASLGEVPFGRYYGTVDATPLFVVLAGAHYARTGDLALARSLWPSIEAALGWIEVYGDTDGDGFVEYAKLSEDGLVNQAWKDSSDSISHADGSLAQGPIACCEVQAYVYAAWEAAATLAEVLGSSAEAERLRAKARALRERFERAFWCEELGTYALALDGAKRPCRVKSSNAGHVLFAGIAGAERARRTAETLLAPDMFSGWGVRTLASSARRYDPMSYHNGSVWPHDNALVAAGLARYGFMELAAQVLTGIADCGVHIDLQRLPELICGFERRPGEGPTSYPVACVPQSWAAASGFSLLQSCLGLSIDAPRATVRFASPILPGFLQQVELDGLVVGDSELDLILTRYHARDVGVNVVARRGPPVRVVVSK